MSAKIGAIILSRCDSSRLPKKVFRKVNDKALLEYVLERAFEVKGLSGVCVATSDRYVDDPIARYCRHNRISCFRGSGSDVASRFINCMEANGWDAGLRINGDSPLHNHRMLTQAVHLYTSLEIDLITNVFPRSYPIGMSVELVSRSALRRAHAQMNKASNFEHVTEFLYENPAGFHFEFLPANSSDHSTVRLAVDTPADFERFKWIIGELGSEYLHAPYEQIINLYMSYEQQAS